MTARAVEAVMVVVVRECTGECGRRGSDGRGEGCKEWKEEGCWKREGDGKETGSDRIKRKWREEEEDKGGEV